MKRFILAMFAVVLAIGFSAFTKAHRTGEVYYFINGEPQVVSENPCPNPGGLDCTIRIDQQDLQLFHDREGQDPVKWDGM